MNINITLENATLANFRTSFIKLRPTVTNEGNQLVIKHKNTTFRLPKTITGTSNKGFIK
jgi:hypothetical protein